MGLRDYQTNGVNLLRASYKAGRNAPVYVLPTGGGKTRVFSYIAQMMESRNKRAIILVHRRELLMQASRSLREIDVRHSLIAPGFTYRGESIAIASVQTLQQRMKKQAFDFDLIIVDEAHHAVAGTWKKIIAAFPKAKILGVTATPTRGDGKGLGVESGGCFDDLILGPSMQWLIDEGYLVRPLTFLPPLQFDLGGVHIRKGDYDAKELAEVLDKPKITGSAVAHYARICPFKPAIVFCASVDHAKHVAAEFVAAGFKAKSVDGKMSESERREAIGGLATGEIHVLTSCEIVSEGTDIPVVTAAILLRPTQSEGLFLQQVGRALRPIYADGFDLSTREGRLAAIAASDKPRALILDHVGNVGSHSPGGIKPKHGLPEQDREWPLEGRKKRDRKATETKDPMRQCPDCYAWHTPTPTCPQCGHVYTTKEREIQVVEGELKPLTQDEIALIAKQKRVEQGKAQSLEDLIALGKARNYKNPIFWAKHVLKARGIAV
jgi:DNA repair protein RadD